MPGPDPLPPPHRAPTARCRGRCADRVPGGVQARRDRHQRQGCRGARDRGGNQREPEQVGGDPKGGGHWAQHPGCLRPLPRCVRATEPASAAEPHCCHRAAAPPPAQVPPRCAARRDAVLPAQQPVQDPRVLPIQPWRVCHRVRPRPGQCPRRAPQAGVSGRSNPGRRPSSCAWVLQESAARPTSRLSRRLLNHLTCCPPSAGGGRSGSSSRHTRRRRGGDADDPAPYNGRAARVWRGHGHGAAQQRGGACGAAGPGRWRRSGARHAGR